MNLFGAEQPDIMEHVPASKTSPDETYIAKSFLTQFSLSPDFHSHKTPKSRDETNVYTKISCMCMQVGF